MSSHAPPSARRVTIGGSLDSASPGERRDAPGSTGKRRARRRRRWIGLVAVLVAAVGLAYEGVVVWEVHSAAHQHADQAAEAAVVMGAAQYDGAPSGALAGRLERAAELYNDGMVDTIIVTGGNQPGDRTTEGMTGFVYLRDLGLPESALLVENGSTNTWEQLLATKLILDEHDISTVILVSDPYHNRRLLDTSAELGLDAQVAPTDSPLRWHDLARECVGVSVGKIIGFRRLAQL